MGTIALGSPWLILIVFVVRCLIFWIQNPTFT